MPILPSECGNHAHKSDNHRACRSNIALAATPSHPTTTNTPNHDGHGRQCKRIGQKAYGHVRIQSTNTANHNDNRNNHRYGSGAVKTGTAVPPPPTPTTTTNTTPPHVTTTTTPITHIPQCAQSSFTKAAPSTTATTKRSLETKRNQGATPAGSITSAPPTRLPACVTAWTPAARMFTRMHHLCQQTQQGGQLEEQLCTWRETKWRW